MTRLAVLGDLRERERVCWDMAGVFLGQRDFHGLHDMGVEIAALRRAITEVERTHPGKADG